MWKPSGDAKRGTADSLSKLRSQIDQDYAKYRQQRSQDTTTTNANSSTIAIAEGRSTKILTKTESSADAALALLKSKPKRKDKVHPVVKDSAASEFALENAKAHRALKRKAELYDILSKKPSSSRFKGLLSSENTLVDFDLKRLEQSDDNDEYSEEDMVEVEDEYGRRRMVNKDEARRIAGITANLPEDYKEYTRRDQYGYHMFPPTQSLGGRAELVDEAKKKQEEAKEEWKNVLLRDDEKRPERYDPEWELRDLGTLNYKFSRDEESREKEMEALKRVHEETKQEHYFSEESKQKRQQKIRERLEKFRQSKAESSSEIITKQPEVIEDRDAEEFLSSVLGKQV